MTPRPRDFREAAPGPGWAALPLPALILDADGRVAAMNDAAEIWLNLSRNSTLGRALDGDEMSMRLRLQPGLGPLLARVRASEEAITSWPCSSSRAGRVSSTSSRERSAFRRR